MYKATQDARHLQRREGSFATVPSARGVNLLGWEEPENLSPAEQRKAIGRRVGQIQTFLAAHKDLRGQDKWRLVKELTKLIQRMRDLKPAARAEVSKKDVPQHFMAVARERLSKPEFEIWLKEARERTRACGVPGAPLDQVQPDELRRCCEGDVRLGAKCQRCGMTATVEHNLPATPGVPGTGRKRLCRDCADFAQDGIRPNDGKPCSSAGVPVVGGETFPPRGTDGLSNGQEGDR